MKRIETLQELSRFANYSTVDKLTMNPYSNKNGDDYQPREVLSGHYVLLTYSP